MKQLSQKEIEIIESLVKKMGLSKKKELSEIVDHVSCGVEQKMEVGLDFQQSLEKVVAGFGKDDMKIIQRQSGALLMAKRKRRFGLSMPIAAVLMFVVIVVNASGRPDTRPVRENLTAVNELFSKNINGFLYDVTGKLDIYATANGEVEKIIAFSEKNERRYAIILKHKNGYKTIYANLQTLLVIEGQHVEKGDGLGSIHSTKKGSKVFFAYKILNSGKPVAPGSYY